MAPTLLVHYIKDHHYLPPVEFLALFAAEVESVREEELNRLIEDHGRKLATKATRDDILVPLHEVQVIWPNITLPTSWSFAISSNGSRGQVLGFPPAT